MGLKQRHQQQEQQEECLQEEQTPSRQQPAPPATSTGHHPTRQDTGSKQRSCQATPAGGTRSTPRRAKSPPEVSQGAARLQRDAPPPDITER